MPFVVFRKNNWTKPTFEGYIPIETDAEDDDGPLLTAQWDILLSRHEQECMRQLEAEALKQMNPEHTSAPSLALPPEERNQVWERIVSELQRTIRELNQDVATLSSSLDKTGRESRDAKFRLEQVLKEYTPPKEKKKLEAEKTALEARVAALEKEKEDLKARILELDSAERQKIEEAKKSVTERYKLLEIE